MVEVIKFFQKIGIGVGILIIIILFIFVLKVWLPIFVK